MKVLVFQHPWEASREIGMGFVSTERGIILWDLPKGFDEGRRKEIVGRVGPLLVSPQSSIRLVDNTFAQ